MGPQHLRHMDRIGENPHHQCLVLPWMNDEQAPPALLVSRLNKLGLTPLNLALYFLGLERGHKKRIAPPGPGLNFLPTSVSLAHSTFPQMEQELEMTMAPKATSSTETVPQNLSLGASWVQQSSVVADESTIFSFLHHSLIPQIVSLGDSWVQQLSVVADESTIFSFWHHSLVLHAGSHARQFWFHSSLD